MMKLSVDYPAESEELEIIRRTAAPMPVLQPMATAEDILRSQAVVQSIKASDVLLEYVVRIVRATREPGALNKVWRVQSILVRRHGPRSRWLLRPEPMPFWTGGATRFLKT